LIHFYKRDPWHRSIDSDSTEESSSEEVTRKKI